MRRPILPPALLLALCAAAFLLALPSATDAVGARLFGADLAQEGACTVQASMSAEAAEVAAGADVGLTMNVDADCPEGNYGPLHIVLLIQASKEMANDPDAMSNPREEVRKAASDLLDRLDLANNPWIRVGIVEYNDQPNRLCSLTNDREELDDCLSSLRATGDTRLDAGIEQAGNVLLRGRGPAGPSLQEWILIFGDGTNDYDDQRPTRSAVQVAAAPAQGCEPVTEAADELKTERPDLILGVVCLAAGCDRTCMRAIANPTQYIFSTDSLDRSLLTLMERNITQMSRGGPIQEVVITNTLGSAFTYVADSGNPPPDTVTGDTLTWRWGNPDQSSFEASLRVAPTTTGEQAACASAVGTETDRAGGVTSFTFDCPTLTVTGMVEPPSPTATATMEATVTPTPIVDFVQCEISGTVFEAMAGAGNESEGALVTCEHGVPNSGSTQACGADQTTGADGAFSFSKRVFLGDRIVLRASKEGFAAAETEIAAQGCSPGGAVSGDLVLQEAAQGGDIYLPVTLANAEIR